MTEAANAQQHKCGNCGTMNSAVDQYCAGCGLFQWEKCKGCSKLVMIGQAFCNKCGFNLKSDFEKRISDFAGKLDRCETMRAEGRISESIKIAKMLSSPEDYRFIEQAERAKQLAESMTQERQHWADELPNLEKSVEEAYQVLDYKLVVSLVGKMPLGLRPEAIQARFEECSSKIETGRTCKAILKDALASKDWPAATESLVQLIAIYPQKPKYTDMLTSVGEKVAKKTRKLIALGEHGPALANLNTIPVQFQSEDHAQLRNSLEDLLSARKLAATAAFATPAVSTLLNYLLKAGEDEKAKLLVKNFSKAKKEKEYCLFPRWIGKGRGFFQEPIVPATIPGSLTRGSKALQKNAPQFWVALGLALQGIGFGDETTSLLQKKQSVLSKLFSRKSKLESAWGMDIGVNSIKVILASKTETGFQIEKANRIPIHVDGESTPKATALFRACKQVFDEVIPEGEPVVANISSEAILARFIAIPLAEKPKKLQEFVIQEAKANIPIRFEDLSLGYQVFPPESEHASSQQAVCFAPRKADVESHISLLEKSGANLIAVIPEPMAYWNCLNALDFLDEAYVEGDSLLVIDVGAQHTSFVTCSPHGIWFRTVHWGTDTISNAFARKLKITNAEADKIRVDLLHGDRLASNVETLKDACAVPRRELERSIRVAKEQLGEFRISLSVLTGGGVFQPLLSTLLNGELDEQKG